MVLLEEKPPLTPLLEWEAGAGGDGGRPLYHQATLGWSGQALMTCKENA